MTADNYKSLAIAEYLDCLASDAPEPGGGSAAAIVGALAAALVAMVANLTLGKQQYAGAEGSMVEMRRSAQDLLSQLSDLATLDGLAYGSVVAAMRLPTDTPTARNERETALQAALKEAAQVPLRVAQAALAVAGLSVTAATQGNTHALSDAGEAAILAHAAVESAALNVKINLRWIADEEFNRMAENRIEEIAGETADLRELALSQVNNRLAGG